MSRQSRRQRKQPRMIQAPAKGQSGWPAVAVVFGLMLVCFALFALELTGRTLLFWLYRDDYIRTELKVTDLSPGGDTIVFGIVAATGEEIHFSHVPTELFEFDSPSDPTGTLMKPETARGKVVPIWFAQDHNSFFSSARVQYVSEFDTLPSGTRVLGIAAVNLAIFAVGAWCTVFGIRRANARAIPTQQS